MASSVLPFALPVILPSYSQVALAIVLVQSKPRDMAIRDYALQLREHFKPGQPAYNSQDLGHYLDLATYWRDCCQSIQDECDRLHSMNIRLERSNQALSQRTEALPVECSSTTSTTSKRKAPASPKRVSKRPKDLSSIPIESSVAQTQEGIENDYDFLEGLGDDGAAIIDALYETHKTCRETAPNAQLLCHHLVRTSNALARIVRFVARHHEQLSRQGKPTSRAQSLGEDKSDFALSLTVSARAFMSVLVGISTMSETSGDDRLSSLVICELAEMFKEVLLAIELCARKTAESVQTTTVQPKKSKSKSPVAAAKESMPARLIAHFLIGLLGLLNKSNATHQKIFDGFAFHLIERVGRRLYYCTFGRHRSKDIGNNLIVPNETLDTADRLKDTEALGIRYEVKALVLILERAMGLAPHHMNLQKGNSARNPVPTSDRIGRTLSMKTLPSAPKGRLSSAAKDRLQRTLVTCMYGSKVDDEFLDVLTKPVPSVRMGSLPNAANIVDDNVERWFKEEIWRLVGWDILSSEPGL